MRRRMPMLGGEDMGTRTPVYPAPQRFPFDVEFQKSLLRTLCEDDGFAHAIAKHLKPSFFENEVLAWAYAACQAHAVAYGGFPGLRTLVQKVQQLESKYRPVYEATLEQVATASLQDNAWMRDAVLDFAKRNVFVRAYQDSRILYNSGQVDQAYDLLMGELEEIRRTTWEPVDRSFYFEELPRRQNRRMNNDPWAQAISTGMPWLDEVLDGGLSLGELGIWIGDAKGGKSAMLVNMGVAATRYQLRNTLHVVFEGARSQVENRYDSVFMDEWYTKVKRGDIDSEKYAQTWEQFQKMRRTLVIRAFTEEWSYTIEDIHNEMKELWRQWGWRPDLIIIDYGDLLNGRARYYVSETAKQKDAFRDIKSLANRGYAIWSASQARRPEKGAEDRAHWLYSREIADCYEKVRIADFLGSLNSTRLEREHYVLRLLAEHYRDNEAGKRIAVYCNFGKMQILQRDGVTSPSMPDLLVTPPLGYGQGQQSQSQQVPQQQQAFG